MPKVPYCSRRRTSALATLLLVLLTLVASAERGIADPIISLRDVDLGEIGRGLFRQTTLSICNAGDGRLTFANPGGAVVTGLGDGFTVSSKDLERLAAASLGPGECYRLTITFVATTPGVHTTTIRVWASTRATKDTAVLRATVTEPSPRIVGYDFGPRQVSSAGSTCTKNPVADYVGEIVLENHGSGALVVDRIELSGDGIGGAIRLDSSDGAPRILRGDMLRAATSTDTARIRQRVRFAPDAERSYGAVLVIAFSDGSTVRDTITGVGLERHVAVPDSIAFGGVTASSLPVRRTVVVTSGGSTPSTLSGASIDGDGAFAIVGGLDALPVTLEPGATHRFEIELRRAADGPHEAVFSVSGDFARCDDSTTKITATLDGIGAAEDELARSGVRIVAAPNVATTHSTLRYDLARAGHVRIDLVDALGSRTTVLDEQRVASGSHQVAIDVAALATGHYACVLTTGGVRTTTRLLIVR